MTTTMNGNVRKSLAEQIDRLDQILDGLAESLSGAVADAVRESVGQAVQVAVQAVLTELLNNPAVQERLRAGIAPAAATPPQPARIPRLVSCMRSWASIGWAQVRAACAAGIQRATSALATVQQHAQLVWDYRVPLLASASAGVALGAAAYYAGPWVAATAGSVAGFTAATATQLTLALRRMLDRFGSSDAKS